MSSGRRVAFAAVAMALTSGGLVTLVMTVNEPRPVNVRRVDPSPVRPGELSATYTTTVEVVRSTTPVEVEVVTPPAARPVPPPIATTTTTPEPPPVTTAPTTTSSWLPPWQQICDRSHLADGICVPWRPPAGTRRLCDWLGDHGLTRVEVHGLGHHLDVDGIACVSATTAARPF